MSSFASKWHVSVGLARAAGAALVMAVLLLAMAAVNPTGAFAASSVAYSVNNSGVRTDYRNASQAMQAACEGVKVIMDADWIVADPLEVPAGKEASIQMNGKRIRVTPIRRSSVIKLNANSKLTLTGGTQATFEYTAYGNEGGKSDAKITAGGLVTNAYSVQGGGAILMEEGSSLNLDGVAVAGNYASGGGAGILTLGKGCSISLKDSVIKDNFAFQQGGGIFVAGEDTTISLDNSSLINNSAYDQGGGIYSDDDGTTIKMSNGAKISGNASANDGGGIYFNYSYFTLVSDDSTGVVSNNWTRKNDSDGGGIYIDSWHRSNEGHITGVTIKDNTATRNGGGVFMGQEWTTLKNCTITGNVAGSRGGGVYDDNDKNTIDGGKIQSNKASNEGGGVFVPSKHDVSIGGVLIISGNARGSNSADDLFLDSSTFLWFDTWAYAKGTVQAGSSIGIRTGTTGKRRAVQGVSNYIQGTFFTDLDDYHLQLDGSELWQCTGLEYYQVSLNGANRARYCRGMAATVNGKSTDASKAFWYWDTANSTGLSPVGSYITDIYNPLLSFTMPQNDVSLKAVYADCVKNVIVDIESPVAGQELPSSAKVLRADSGTQASAVVTASVTWSALASDGSLVPVAGKAQPGTTYVASVSAAPQVQEGLFFSGNITAANVKIKQGTLSTGAASASVDAATGMLTVVTGQFKTDGAAVEVAQDTVSIELENAGLYSADSASVAEAADTSADASGKGALSTLGVASAQSDAYVVTYALDSQTMTICAPAMEGMNFNHWEGVPDGISYDDEAGTVTLDDASLASQLDLTAVYTPVMTRIELGLDAPVAGKGLGSKLTSLVAGASDGTSIDLLAGFAAGRSLDVTWSPAAQDGKAAYLTSYTATIVLADAEGLVGVEDVLARDAQVVCSGQEIGDAAAAFAIENGKLCLKVSFAATAGPQVDSVAQPLDAELSFELAQELAEAKCDSASAWGLPKSTMVTTLNGETMPVDIDWDMPQGFDPDAPATQVLTATGTLDMPSYLAAGDVSTKVETAVKVGVSSKAVADKAAAQAVTGKAKTVKADAVTHVTAKALSMSIKAPRSESGTKATFATVSKAKQLKVKNGKVTLKKGAKKGKRYIANVKVSYGSFSKVVKVVFKVR